SADSLVNRIIQWSLAIHITIQSPIFGISPGGFKTIMESIYGTETVFGPHNTILFLWMNYGLVGLFCYVFYLYRVMKKLALMTRIDHRYRGILAGYMGLFIFGMFEPLVVGISFEIMLALIAAEAIGYFRYYSGRVALSQSTKYWRRPGSDVVQVGSTSQ
ncbi:MAG: O-antigen ligase family protein, partial [Candidatus Saccharimonadales bacterium]